MLKHLIVIFLVATLSACATANRSNKATLTGGVVDQTVENTENLSQKTIRYQEKVTLAKALCSLQSDNHQEQKITTEVEYTPIVIVDGTFVEVPQSKMTSYDNSVKPFDMVGCIEESLRWGGERLLGLVISKASDLLTKTIYGVAAVEIADRITDNSGVRIDGVEEGATVSVGTDNADSDVDNSDNRDLSDNSDNRSDQAGDGSVFNSCEGEVIDGVCSSPPEEEVEEVEE